MPRVFGRPNTKPRQQLPCPDGVTTVPCKRCHEDTPWADFPFRNSKEYPGTLYRAGVCLNCSTQYGRMRAARSFVKHCEDDEIELALFLIDRAAYGNAGVGV